MITEQTTRCFHCGIPIVGNPENRVWCNMCASRSRGWCPECDQDVAKNTGCWQMDQELKTALVRGRFATNTCLDCKMGLVMRELGIENGVWKCRWVCPKCKAELVVTWSRPKRQPPPPGDGMPF